MSWREYHYANVDELAEVCATRLLEATQRAMASGEEPTLALAGGRTAPPIFRCLSAQTLPWQKITVVPTDERWVDYEHPDCNLHQLRDSFANAPGLLSLALVPDQPGPRVDAGLACEQLAKVPQRFSAVMLGMGADGHFASLFPGAPNLAAALDPESSVDAFAIVPNPLPSAGPHSRITLSLSRLLRTRQLMLVISGEDKLQTLRQAQKVPSAFPVGALLHAAGAQVDVFWSAE